MSIVRVWDDVSSEEELAKFWAGVDKIIEEDCWDSDKEVGSAASTDGEQKRVGRAKWMGALDWQIHSDEIHGINGIVDRLFKGYTSSYAEEGIWEKAMLLTNCHNTLLNYYDHGDHYKPHWDYGAFTCLFWFCREPKRFTGGDLHLPDFNDTIPFRHNRLVIFPGQVGHAVTTVEVEEGYRNQGYGRYCLSAFLNNNPALREKR